MLRAWRSLLRMVVVALLTVTVAAAFGGLDHRLELFCHFRAQYALCGAALVLLLLTSRMWRTAGLALVAVLWHAWAIVPWQIAPGPRTLNSGTKSVSIRILEANVLTGNSDASRLIEFIHREQPDVLVLMEVNHAWMERLALLRATHPHQRAEPRPDNFGIAVFSRLPISDSAVQYLGESDVPSIRAELATAGGTVTLVATHPVPPVGRENAASRNSQLRALADIAGAHWGPFIVAGDLNVTMWSPHYTRFIETSGLHDSREGFGLCPTWHSSLPAMARIPIDHVLCSSDFLVTDCRVGPEIGSDHRPLLVELNLQLEASADTIR